MRTPSIKEEQNHLFEITPHEESISSIVQALLETKHTPPEELALQAGVSVSTLNRWATGSATPRPCHEGKLRSIYHEYLPTSHLSRKMDAVRSLSTTDFSDLRSNVDLTLKEARETLHRRGRLSSRHEALDEVGKLLFTHVISIRNGGKGISPTLQETKNPAESLRSIVNAAFKEYLPTSLSHELTPSDFELRMKTTEDALASELITAFKPLSLPSSLDAITNAKGVDVLNDTFGQFMADSFVDEKELGQYLTPKEVVDFMTALGLSSLSQDHFDTLCDPQKCNHAGFIFDPSCGVGSFLAAVVQHLYPHVRAKHNERRTSQWVNDIMSKTLVGVDKSERMIKLAATNLALFGIPASNLHLANALERGNNGLDVTAPLKGKVRLILTNPPFGAEFDSQALKDYRIASDWPIRQPKTITSELLFIERYIE